MMPTARPRALLTMEDMGHGSGHTGMDHSQINHTDMQGMDHSTMNPAGMQGMDHSQMNHAGMQGMDHSKMNHTEMPDMDHVNMNSASLPNQSQSPTNAPVQGWANAATPQGQKALQYSDLVSLEPQKDTRPAERELEIRLGGTMERYIWTINGKKFTDMQPLQVKYGERVRLKFINDSMMAHPMHLHGMFMQLENGQSPANMPNKHTLIVPPGKTVTALLTADELGEWAIHCHLLYHMSAGMMSKLVVATVDEQQAQGANTQAAQPSKQGVEHAH